VVQPKGDRMRHSPSNSLNEVLLSSIADPTSCPTIENKSKPIRLRSWRDVASHQLGGCRTVEPSAATDTLPAITRPIASDDERLGGGSTSALTSAAVLREPVPAPEIEQEISRNSLIYNGNKSHPPGVSTIDGGQAVPQQAAHLKFLQLLKLRHPFKGTTK
jgi:hypothetical protein